MKAVLGIAVLLGLSGCATLPPAATTVGGTANVSGLRVHAQRIIEDSRCPATVQCVWAGRVRLLVDATRGDGLYAERVLTLGQPENIDWGVLTLVRVDPPKTVPGSTAPAAYRFTFTFTPAS